jgi:plasmid stabilization system protein ParE
MFRVSWSRRALARLADIWVHSTDQNAVTAAVDTIDRALAADPGNQGESRPNNRRVMFARPLGVSYRVDGAGNRVRVLAVWRISRP